MKKIVLTIVLIALTITLNSCTTNNSSSASGNYAYKVRMTDAPGPYDAVNVDIRSVEVIGADGNTVTLNTVAGVYNLLDFSNGADTLIATSMLSNSSVKQIRLILGSNNTVVVNGVSHPLSTPSAEQSGLKLLVDQTLHADIDNSILIDFDAHNSIIQTGNGTYKLKPVLRTVVAAISGSITGSLSPAGTVAAVTATSAANVDYSSSVDASGNFKICGLPPGAYTITITPLLPLLPVIQTNVMVTAGTTTNVGIVAF